MPFRPAYLGRAISDLGGGQALPYVKERGCVAGPSPLGHEALRQGRSRRPAREGVKVGQKRIVYPWIGCGQCPGLQGGGRDNYCLKSQVSWGVNRGRGAYSPHVLVPDAKYLVDASGIDESFGGPRSPARR